MVSAYELDHMGIVGFGGACSATLRNCVGPFTVVVFILGVSEHIKCSEYYNEFMCPLAEPFLLRLRE